MNAPADLDTLREPSPSAVRARRQADVVAALAPLLPAHALLWQPEDTVPYECDGLTAYRELPLVVALPETKSQVAAVLKACHALDVPVVARGAGTGLSGGAMPTCLGVTLSLAKFNKILKVDPVARTATVQGGVRNLAISEAAAPFGLYYAPDPSSQIACTIGGNVAENSGGVHCLKYGLTVHNVLRVRGFTISGEPVSFGSEALDAPGPGPAGGPGGQRRHAGGDDRGDRQAGAQAGTGALHHGQLRRCAPGRRRGRRDHRRRHHPGRAGDDGQADDAPRSRTSCTPATTWTRPRSCCAKATARRKRWKRRSAAWPRCCASSGATGISVSEDEAQRLKFWSGRKNAFPASGRISPDYMCMDSTIPRKRLADILIAIQQMEEKYGLKCCNVFHAGDGNLHPLILFDANDPDQLHRCELFGADILETSVAMGGTVTGEHGVGVEKLSSMCVQFSPAEREQMLGLKRAFDPKGLLNPGKVIPTLVRCAEYGKMHVRKGLLPFPDLPRF